MADFLREYHSSFSSANGIWPVDRYAQGLFEVDFKPGEKTYSILPQDIAKRRAAEAARPLVETSTLTVPLSGAVEVVAPTEDASALTVATAANQSIWVPLLDSGGWRNPNANSQA